MLIKEYPRLHIQNKRWREEARQKVHNNVNIASVPIILFLFFYSYQRTAFIHTNNSHIYSNTHTYLSLYMNECWAWRQIVMLCWLLSLPNTIRNPQTYFPSYMYIPHFLRCSLPPSGILYGKYFQFTVYANSIGTKKKNIFGKME